MMIEDTLKPIDVVLQSEPTQRFEWLGGESLFRVYGAEKG